MSDQSRTSIFGFFKPKTPRGEQALKEFEVDYTRHIIEIGSVSLKILVWGPGLKSKSEVAKKRREIRDNLVGRGHVALFTEEIPIIDRSLSLRSRELAQALAADLLLILPEDSLGAIGETEAYCSHPKLAYKAYILAPEKYRDGFSGQGILSLLERTYNGVRWYTDAELKDCLVLSAAIERVQALQELFAASMLEAPDSQR